MFVECILYADNMVLFGRSRKGLQFMLDLFDVTRKASSLSFNATKSYWLVIGKLYISDIPRTAMSLNNGYVELVVSIKHLGLL